jgi:hypothetical protein
MSEITTLKPTVKKPAGKVSKSAKRKLKESIQPEGQVVVHCSVRTLDGTIVRIWKSTYLIPRDSEVQCPLLHWENISLYPHWTPIPPRSVYRFTLIFAPLPASCTLFDLEEIIPQPGGFSHKNIHRNKTDVYSVDLT